METGNWKLKTGKKIKKWSHFSLWLRAHGPLSESYGHGVIPNSNCGRWRFSHKLI